jgi:hypothetical protein
LKLEQAFSKAFSAFCLSGACPNAWPVTKKSPKKAIKEHAGTFSAIFREYS